jgi:tRNA dimethylallyltransferase
MAAAQAGGNPHVPPPALIVAGPTCSGKSALALELAEAFNGAIINTDAMQCYGELRVLTARPSDADTARVPHLLYGVRPAARAGSVAWWRGAALAALEACTRSGLLPILCGGTGMYFAALRDGLADIPDPGTQARTEARALLAENGPAWLHEALTEADPATAARLFPSDGQRLARAWEVWRGTGKGLAAWHTEPGLAPAPYGFTALLLDPPRSALRPAIEARFATMLTQGAADEVSALLTQTLDPALPAMRAHGVPEIAAALRGEITWAEAEARAVAATLRYTKRQATWFRHHALAAPDHQRTITSRFTTVEQFSKHEMTDLQNFVRLSLDAPQHAP